MMKSRCVGLGLTIVFCLAAVITSQAQGKAILTLADQYSIALKKFQAKKRRSSVEGVIHKGKAVAEKLEEIESLSDAEYALLKKKMKGFAVNREEILFIQPESKFFAKLAGTHGTRADVAFSSLMSELRPNDVWPAYSEQQTDVTGCTKYGNGSLTRLYGRILRFKRTYPKAYVPDISEEADAILDEFTGNTCACGTRNSVIREFESFLMAFPKDQKARLIRKRLSTIKRSKDFRFNCQSG
ncbi:MAG: hypothetical protein ABJA02_05725 [Acidobacteriota bacterium]